MAGKLDHFGVVAGPDVGSVLICQGGVQCLNKLIYFTSHHHEHLRTSCVDSGERVGGPGSDGQVFTLLENTAGITDEHLEATTKYTERLIGSMVHVGWRLVTGIRLQVPPSEHEVIHDDSVASMAPCLYGIGDRRGWRKQH